MKKIDVIRSGHKNVYRSPKAGFLKINIEKLRSLLVRYQKSEESSSNIFPDPCGIIFKTGEKENVEEGQVIATFRINSKHKKQFIKALNEVIQIQERFQQGSDYEILN